jgi:hypothetical protein
MQNKQQKNNDKLYPSILHVPSFTQLYYRWWISKFIMPKVPEEVVLEGLPLSKIAATAAAFPGDVVLFEGSETCHGNHGKP